jgi:transposase
MRPTGSAAELEARRLRAVDLLRNGKSNTEVARLIGVDVSSVKRWKRALAHGGLTALAAKPNRGRPSRLTLEQMQALSSLVRAGAQAAGFRTDLWTCRRVAQAIRDRFGVTLSPQRQRISTYWQFYDDNVVATDVVAFLRLLHRQQGRKLIVVLDRFNVHRKAVRLLKESGQNG